MRTQSAIQARNYFESLKTQKPGIKLHEDYASAHYCVDAEGPVLCVPEDEIAYHSGSTSYKDDAEKVGIPPWNYAIGIEMCFDRRDGKPEGSTISFTVDLVKDICIRHDLSPLHNVWRHYDMTGKLCPRYYVKNEIDWTGLKQRIYESIVYTRNFSCRDRRYR